MSKKSVEQVARDVLNSILAKSIEERAEYGGMVYSQSGSFFATKPRTQGYGNTVDVGLHEKNMSCPDNTLPVAFYHTHPNVSAGGLPMKYNEFSDEDKESSEGNAIDAYLGTIDGSFFKYDRKIKKPLRLAGRLKNTTDRRKRG